MATHLWHPPRIRHGLPGQCHGTKFVGIALSPSFAIGSRVAHACAAVSTSPASAHSVHFLPRACRAVRAFGTQTDSDAAATTAGATNSFHEEFQNASLGRHTARKRAAGLDRSPPLDFAARACSVFRFGPRLQTALSRVASWLLPPPLSSPPPSSPPPPLPPTFPPPPPPPAQPILVLPGSVRPDPGAMGALPAPADPHPRRMIRMAIAPLRVTKRHTCAPAQGGQASLAPVAAA